MVVQRIKEQFENASNQTQKQNRELYGYAQDHDNEIEMDPVARGALQESAGQ
jgi:hypothetical protein